MKQNKRNKWLSKLIDYYFGQVPASPEIEQAIQEENEIKKLADRVKEICFLLDSYEVKTPPNLEEKIINAVHNEDKLPTSVELIEREAGTTDPIRERRVFYRVFDTIATAASIILIISAILLSTSQAQKTARKTICQSNLGIIGTGFSSYAIDFPNQLPLANIRDKFWYDSKHHRAKRPHLFILVKYHYVNPKFFICPEDRRKFSIPKSLDKYFDFPESMIVSYSFQNLFGDRRFTPKERARRWEQAEHLIILADKTPLLKDEILLPELPTDKTFSPNHLDLYGQNILKLNGSVSWLNDFRTGPEKDNIWQAGRTKRYTGKETPISPTDIFLAP